MTEFTTHPHDGDSFEVRLGEVPLGLVTLSEDECSWYTQYIPAHEGDPDRTELCATRREAAEELIRLGCEGRLGMWES